MPPSLDTQPVECDPRAEAESHTSTTPTLHVDIVDPHIKRPTSDIALHYWCYALHGFLLITQVALLAMLYSHPEHSVTLTFDNSALTIGLSAFLQAFYTLYTVLLVFITQRLAVSKFLSCRQKLTAIHDVSGAWSGLGAATAALWNQTKLAASTKATFLVFLYLACVSVLHVASPTIMEFEAYNATSTTAVPSKSTWPDPSVNLSSLDMAAVGPLIPLMHSLSGLSTDGLINSTLYDTFTKTPQMINASVNASTIRANCGLLPILAYQYLEESDVAVMNTSISGIGETEVEVSLSAFSYDQVLLLEYNGCTGCTNPLVYVASTGMNMGGSIGSNVSLYLSWYNFMVPGGQNASATVYLVGCSLDVSSYEYDLEIENGTLEPTMDQPDSSSDPWSMWAPVGNNSGWGTELDSMVFSAYKSTLCTDSACYSSSNLDGYLMSLLGITSTNTSSTSPSVILSPYELESAVSQVAAQLIWIAGQPGENGEEFVPTSSVAEVAEQVARWRLNINGVIAACTFIASLSLCITVYLILGVPPKIAGDRPLVGGTTVLEVLWIGAHSRSLRKRLQTIYRPSSETLRCGGMFEINVAQEHSIDGGRNYEEESLLATGFSRLEPEDETQAGNRKLERPQDAQSRTRPFIKLSRHFWCYLLHGTFVAFHIALLFLLISHPEHRVVLQSVNGISTTVLAASLQLFYVLYTLGLVFITQRVTISRATVSRQSLTSVHDVSQAWTGIGSALVGLWQQTKVPASVRMTLAVTTYYVCILVLHVSSTTIMQFEVFSSTRDNTAQSTLAWPASFDNNTYEWSVLSTLVPLDQLPSLSTQGLVNNTVYDTPLVDSTSVNATVNATTIHANCGLLSNLSFHSNSGVLSLNASGGPNLAPIRVSISIVVELWKDMVLFINPISVSNSSNLTSMCPECSDVLLYWVTTALDIDDSLSDVSVSTNWTYTPPGGNATSSNTTTYVVACSLDATTSSSVLDVQNNTLTGTSLTQLDNTSESWSLWSVGGTPGFGTQMSMAIFNSTLLDETVPFEAALTVVDVYLMSQFGINFTASNISSATESSANPSVTLTPSQFEDAISQLAAQYVWTAGNTNGTYGPANGFGESIVTDLVALRRLNVNTLPVIVASVASLILFLLVFYMIGVTTWKHSPISELGVLETLWLEAHSETLHERMLLVRDPTLYNLRVAGMLGVCLADDIREALENAAQDDVVDIH